ncbi:hypothetical protein NHJ13734_009899 [Beauveria thailandica]
MQPKFKQVLGSPKIAERTAYSRHAVTQCSFGGPGVGEAPIEPDNALCQHRALALLVSIPLCVDGHAAADDALAANLQRQRLRQGPLEKRVLSAAAAALTARR